MFISLPFFRFTKTAQKQPAQQPPPPPRKPQQTQKIKKTLVEEIWEDLKRK